MRVRPDSSLVLLLAFALATCGCGGGGSPEPAPPHEPARVDLPAQTAVPPAAPTGTIEGVVVLAEGAELPRRPDPKTTSKLPVVDPPAPCSPIDSLDLLPVQLEKEGRGLISVHVAITGMKTTAAAAPRTHQIALEDCRLNRPILAARMGDFVTIKNASGAPLLPTLPGAAYMEAILPGAERTVELTRPGLSQLSCAFGAYCGQTDLMVTSHSLFAVTDKTGHFRIEGVPLDVDLTVNAWHPLFSVSTQPIRLTGNSPAAPLKLTLAPSPQAEPPEAAATSAAKRARPKTAKPPSAPAGR